MTVRKVKAGKDLWHSIGVAAMDAQEARDHVRIAKHPSGRAMWVDTILPPDITYFDKIEVRRLPGPDAATC
jgi:hypothetical protein